MKDNFWNTVYIILGSIIAIMVGYILISITMTTKNVDCSLSSRQNADGSYKPLPKQCGEGEENDR